MTTLNRELELQATSSVDQVPDGFEPVSATELNACAIAGMETQVTRLRGQGVYTFSGRDVSFTCTDLAKLACDKYRRLTIKGLACGCCGTERAC